MIRNVLSLFDGMSCGQIALKELGVKFDNYYASEIDQNAINHTQLNFPNTIQLGDVCKWEEWDIDWSGVDLILAGSPCQGFSTQGLGRNFDDPRSKLFWVFAEILRYARSKNPKVRFLLENVRMKNEFMSIISREVDVYPICINSARVSAQDRIRYYWTDIKSVWDEALGMYVVDIPQPKDKGLVVKDILEDVQHTESIKFREISYHTKKDGRRYYKTPYVSDGYVATLNSKAFCLHTSYTYTGVRFTDGVGVYVFTPRELLRLQTVPDWYKITGEEYYNTRAIAGNGWTVEVIKHILSFL